MREWEGSKFRSSRNEQVGWSVELDEQLENCLVFSNESRDEAKREGRGTSKIVRRRGKSWKGKRRR